MAKELSVWLGIKDLVRESRRAEIRRRGMSVVTSFFSLAARQIGQTCYSYIIFKLKLTPLLHHLLFMGPPEETGCTLPLEETCCSLTACSLPSEERRLAAPYLLRRLAAPYLMRRLAASYLMRRHYSLVIASGPEDFIRGGFLDLGLGARPAEGFIQEALCLELLVQNGSVGCVSLGSVSTEVVSMHHRLYVSFRIFSRPFFLVDLVARSKGVSSGIQRFYLIFLMAKKDMHTYVSRLKDTELETLIATYDIPLDLRPRLPDPNFRMINLPSRQIRPIVISSSSWSRQLRGIGSLLAKCGDPAHVCMEGVKSGLKLWKAKYFLIDHRAIPFHMPWRHPCSWQFLSIHDFRCMPSLDKVTVREEPHGLDTSILDRVGDRTTSPAPVGTAIPRASLEEIAVTWPDRKVVTKADNAAKRKASIGSKISTNATKKTQSSKKRSGAGSSGQAAGDGVEQADDGTLDDDDQRDYPEFATEDIKSLNDANQGEHKNIIPLRTSDSSIGLDVIYPPILLPDKEVEPYGELSGGVRRTTRTGFCVSHGRVSSCSRGCPSSFDAQTLDVDVDVDEISIHGNVDPYYEARVSNTAGDVLKRDLLLLIPRTYYIPYPYDESSENPKVCKTALDRFPTPAETQWLRELFSVELSGHMSVLQCQLIIHESMLNAQYDHSLRNSTVHANEEVSRLAAQLRVFKSRCLTAEGKLSSWDNKHRKYRSERDALAIEKAKIKEELVETKPHLEHHGRQTKEIQVVDAFPATTFPFLDKVSQNSQSSLQDIARLEPDRIMPSHQTSSATTQMSRLIYALPALVDVAFGLGLLNQYGPVLAEQLLGCGPRVRT
ncbi:hypothetical protein Tco_0976500 [Tanacetum coccineum]|uniref:Uncharacterized protein n=1 Tax=Tanacetum coccineum TaxID=301880 RepID=A0ABQ5EHG1_9ASTR